MVLVGNSAAYCHMGYSHCLLGAKPLGASKVLRFPGPKTMRIVVVRGQTSSRTPFILSEVMTDAARGKVPLRFESAASLCPLDGLLLFVVAIVVGGVVAAIVVGGVVVGLLVARL